MKCFYHREVDAIGSCKACSKGLCPACAVDVGSGLACREQCVEQVRRIDQLIDRNIRMAPVSEQLLGGHPRGLFVAGGSAVIAGFLFTILGFGLDGTGRAGITGIGILVILLGVWYLARGWRFRGPAARAAPRTAGDAEQEDAPDEGR